MVVVVVLVLVVLVDVVLVDVVVVLVVVVSPGASVVVVLVDVVVVVVPLSQSLHVSADVQDVPQLYTITFPAGFSIGSPLLLQTSCLPLGPKVVDCGPSVGSVQEIRFDEAIALVLTTV